MSASTPTVIAGRYELQRRLAQGGMAEVWLAIDLTLDRKVAVKWLKPNLATDEIVAERFRREAVAAASLDHGNIVAVHDVFEQDGRQAVVMQLVEGKSLRQLLDAQKRLSPELTCHIGTAVAGALDHAHHAGFVHRDVKPANIMITPDGRVLLTDFGIAKGLHGDGSDDLTSDNIMMGTAKYLSPEQVRGKKLDGRADLYSLGLVLYECLAGRVPFLGETDADTALARLQRDPTDLTQLRATLPRRLVDTIHDLLARNPDRRPATGTELIAELELARAEGPPQVDPTHPGDEPERSPVAPFSAGRLVRAPSDLRGRAGDRHRAVRGNTPPHGKQQKSSRRSPSRPTRRPDLAGAAGRTDRASAAGAPLTDGTARIPGQPDHVTGRTPTTRVHPDDQIGSRAPLGPPDPLGPATSVAAGVSAGQPLRRDDPTPPVGQRIHAPPAKGLGQSWTPSLTIIGGLILIAAVLAVVIALAIGFGGEQNGSAPTSALPNAGASEPATEQPAEDAAPTDTDSRADTPVATGSPDGDGSTTDEATTDAATTDAATTDVAADPAAVRIESIRTYDPDGDDGVEGDDRVADALDGDPTTAWRTSCYDNEWMGGKRGVGVVVTLDAAAARGVNVDVAHAPSVVQFYASDADTVPADLDDWGAPLLTRPVDGAQPTTFTSPVPAGPVRHLLVLVQRLGPDPACSDARPYRGALADVRLS